MNGLTADPDAAEAPGKPVPETLALPVAGARRIGHRGRHAVEIVALRRVVIARTVVIAWAVIVTLRMSGRAGRHD